MRFLRDYRIATVTLVTLFLGGRELLGLSHFHEKNQTHFSILSANQKCVPRNSVVTVLFGCNNQICCYLAVLKCFAFSYCKLAANLQICLLQPKSTVTITCGICTILYAGLAAFAALCMQDLRHFVCRT